MLEKISIGHIAIGLIVWGLLQQGDEIKSGLRDSAETSIQRSEARRSRQDARNAKSRSKIALERAEANCIKVIDAETKKVDYFRDGTGALDTQLKRPLRDEALVCNRLGDTAVIYSGVLTDIARAAKKDMPKFLELIGEAPEPEYQPSPTPKPRKSAFWRE